MFYTREEAAEKISQILEKEKPIRTGFKLPIDNQKSYNVYRIPLEYLVPNVLNDRISYKIEEYEAANNIKLSVYNKEHVDFVFDTIEKENPNDNYRTLLSLVRDGQNLDGIITKNGIIIDGNRRATLLRKLYNGAATEFNRSTADFRFFNTIVLEDDISDSRILELESRIQIGEDSKVGYNPICIYLKIDKLTRYHNNDSQIASYMNIKPQQVIDKKEVFSLMKKYLDYIGKPNYYTCLDGLEDQFINTLKIFKKLDSEKLNVEWHYNKEDVARFKEVCYDYLHSKFEGKEYRELLGGPSKADGVFMNKDVWNKFYEHHQSIIDTNNPQNEADWKKLGKGQFKQNLDFARDSLKDTLRDKSVEDLTKTIQTKVRNLRKILDEGQAIDDKQLLLLKEINSEIYKIIKDY